MERRSLDSRIVETPGTCRGKPRIAGHRIKVQHVAVWHERMRMSPKRIAREYQLDLADVHAALAFYYGNKEEIDKDIADDEAFVEEMRKKAPSLLNRKIQNNDG